jgi:tagatose 1,6-diphosphate aldolase
MKDRLQIEKRIGRGKLEGLQAIADSNGIIAAPALDQRGSLKKVLMKLSTVM